MTASAIRSLQRQRSLPVTGTLTVATQKALGRLGRPFFGQRVIKRGMVGWDVSVLQFLLATYGFDVGTLDGRFGPRTQSRPDQRLRGAAADLVPDGISGSATHARLCPSLACRSLPRPPAHSGVGLPAIAIEAAWPAENTPRPWS